MFSFFKKTIISHIPWMCCLDTKVPTSESLHTCQKYWTKQNVLNRMKTKFLLSTVSDEMCGFVECRVKACSTKVSVWPLRAKTEALYFIFCLKPSLIWCYPTWLIKIVKGGSWTGADSTEIYNFIHKILQSSKMETFQIFN
jgi:hypothetical protein